MPEITLVDSIESPRLTGHPIPQAILHAQAIGAYVHGNSWPTYIDYARARPDLDAIGWIVTIALRVQGLERGTARCGDFEPGGMVNSEVGEFLTLADRRWGLPWLYTAASNTAALTAAAARAGYARDEYYVWAAHQNPRIGPHICSPERCGYPRADAGQSFYLPENCDGSLINDYTLPPAQVPVVLDLEEDAVDITATTDGNGHVHVFASVPHDKADATKGGTIYELYQQPDGSGWQGGATRKQKALAYRLAAIPENVA